jgi:hypothetical protein
MAVLVLVALVRALPGLGKVREDLAHAAPGWVAGAAGLELLETAASPAPARTGADAHVDK